MNSISVTLPVNPVLLNTFVSIYTKGAVCESVALFNTFAVGYTYW
jgi:hypothetical protein